MATKDTRMPIESFKELLENVQQPDSTDLIVCKQGVSEIVAEDEPNVLTCTISTASVDREGDTIFLAGWDLDNYRKGGVVLWNHLWDQPPIGKPLKTWIDLSEGKLKCTAEFTPRELNPFGYMIYKLAKHGFSKSTSVGFRPLQWVRSKERSDDLGVDFLRQELTEWSIVNVPANPEALIDAKGMGIDLAPMRQQTERMLDENQFGLLLTKRDVRAMHKVSDDTNTVTVDLAEHSARDTVEGSTVVTTTPDDVSLPAEAVDPSPSFDDLRKTVEEGRKAEGALVDLLVEKINMHINSLAELLGAYENLVGSAWASDEGKALGQKLCGPREEMQENLEKPKPKPEEDPRPLMVAQEAALTQDNLKDLLNVINSLRKERNRR